MAARHIPPSSGMGFHGHDSNYRRGLPTLRFARTSPRGGQVPEPVPAPEPEPEPDREPEPEPEPEPKPEPEPDTEPAPASIQVEARQMEIAGGHFVYVDVTEDTALFVVESDTPEARSALAVSDKLPAGGVAMMLYPMHNDSEGNVFMRTRTVNRTDGTMRDLWALIQPSGAEQTVTDFRIIA